MYIVRRAFDTHVAGDWLDVPRTDRTQGLEQLGLIEWMQAEIDVPKPVEDPGVDEGPRRGGRRGQARS